MRRLAIATLVLSLGLAAVAPPASALDTTTVADQAGDGVGAGDLRALKVSQSNALALSFQVRLNAPTHPARATWTGGSSQTSLRVNLDTDGDPAIEHYLVVEAQPGSPHVQLVHVVGPFSVPRGVCQVNLDFAQPTILRFTLDTPDCLDDPETVRAFARFRFDRGGNGSIDSADRVPNGGYSPPIDVEITV